MPTYRYKARDKMGKIKTGLLQGETRDYVGRRQPKAAIFEDQVIDPLFPSFGVM